MQTDNTVILRDETFNKLKSQKIVFKYKAKTELKRGTAIIFNEYIATRNNDDVITVTQKEQGKKLLLVNTTRDIKQQYLK